MTLASRLVAMCLLLISVTAGAEKITLLSWNLEHMMSVSGFERWRSFCEPHDFSDAMAQSRGQDRPAGVTFCTAHMGTGWPPRSTPAKPGVSACPRQHVAVQTLALHLERQRAMREQVAAMAADVDVLLFQEVVDAKAVAELLTEPLARDFQVLTLHDLVPANYPVAQLLAAAVRRSKFREIRQGLYAPLAQKTEEGHQVRPGQVVHLTLHDGTSLSILNVHLKAGCNQFDLQDPWSGSRSSNPDKPTQSCDPYAKPSAITQRQARISACNALRRQLEPLEAWIDARQNAKGLPPRSERFVVAGDFNRRLHTELSPKAGPARLNDASPSEPFSDATIRLVWPEINDGEPASSAKLRLAIPAHGAARANCKQQGIDHFIVSQALAGARGERLSVLELLSVPERVLDVPDRFGQTLMPLSDHCPHRLTIQLS